MASARRRRLATFLCLVVVAATFRSPSCEGPKPSGSEVGSLSGTVQEDRTRQPVPYAILSIVELGRRTVADKDGRFTFQSLPFGRYTLFIDKTGYCPKSFPIDFTPQTLQPIVVSLAPLIYGAEPIIVTASRKEQPANQVPQNVTVLTKDEIESLVANNLAEALNYVPGLAVQINGGPGNVAYPMIQGSEHRHTLVLIDGIAINTETEGLADISQIPLEEIERVEVQKGPGSSAWGSSLGGVINVVTRAPSKEIRGDLRLSFGERNTRKYCVGASGTAADVGYLFTLRRLETDNFRPRNGYRADNLFAKVETHISETSKMTASFGYNNGEGAGDEFIDLGYWTDQRRKNSYATIHLETIPTSWMNLRLSLQGIEHDQESSFFQIDSGDLLSLIRLDERTLGTALQTLIVVDELNTITAGLDLFWSRLESESLGGKREANRKAIWFNNETDTDNFTLILGGRFDHASAYGSQFSPNIGLVYRLLKWKTILRAGLSRGFTAPPLSFKYYENPRRGQLANPDIKPERVCSYQMGVENSYLHWLWVKFGLHRSDVSDAVETVINKVEKTVRKENVGRTRVQGGEIGLRATLPLGLSLSAGGSFNHVKNLRTKRVIKGRPRTACDLGLDYRSPVGFQASLRGHYLWWNQPEEVKAKDRRFVWDLKLSQKLVKTKLGSFKGSLSVHNLFDTKSGWTYRYLLPRRWIEGEVTLSIGSRGRE